MSAKVFPCYPFAHPFEEKVTNFLAKNLNGKFYLIHNVIRPNKTPKIFIPKEIDLCILSKTGQIFLIEIKGYKRPPVIDDVSMNHRLPNPVQQMKEYGQRLRSELKEKENLDFHTVPYLVLKKKDPQKISSIWKDNCLELEEFNHVIMNHAKTSRDSTYSADELDRIREKYLCCANIDPFSGFDQTDFDALRSYEIYYDSFNDEQFYEKVSRPFYYKLRCLGYEIRSRFRQKGISLYQHISTPIPTVPQPIQFVAFTFEDSEEFHTEPQITFHISTKDWYSPGQPDMDHFSVKLAFFSSSKWLRKLMLQFRSDPSTFLRKIKDTLGPKHYLFIATLTPHDNLISKPIKDLKLEDIENLAYRTLDKREFIRGIGFEKPLHYSSHKKLGRKDDLIQFLCKEFAMLNNFLKEILPEYFNNFALNQGESHGADG